MPAIHSRCQGFHIDKTDMVEFFNRVANVLTKENITFSEEILAAYVSKTYPDLRKCIGSLQQNSITGTLKDADSIESTADYQGEMVNLFKAGKISEARKLVCSQALPEEMEDIYRWLYDNVAIFGDEAKQDKAILIIKQGLVDHALIIDPEINLAATLIRLGNL
jgi:DNA polymerase III gamma/tau subunit